ncbi:hypothetical protein [Arthrobacter psychrolactophilus]
MQVIEVDEDYQSFGRSGEIAVTISGREPNLFKHFSRVRMPDTRSLHPRTRIGCVANGRTQRGRNPKVVAE